MRGWPERLLLVCCCLLPLSTLAADYPPLQPLIDATADGETLIPPPGIYAGPVVIERSINLDGQHQVTIDNGGKGSVIILRTDGATVRNLHLTNSGKSHNDLDAGVQVRGRFNVIKDNLIDNCLFGIDLQQSDHNVVRRNRISSKPFELGQRGDAIRLWYSFHNKITDNEINKVRDTVVWYSADNIIARNTASDSRYSLHFMYSLRNVVEDNRYYNNTVGMLLWKLYHRRIASPRIPSSNGLELMRLRRTTLWSDCCRSIPNRQLSMMLSLMTLKRPRTCTPASRSLWDSPELVRCRLRTVAPSVFRMMTLPLPPLSMMTWCCPSRLIERSITTGPA